MEAAIKQALQDIEQQRNIRILYACEAGSRAWGIESKDSDYDVRFIYVRPRDAYLSLDAPQDVIEVMKDDLDICGWDIFKSLRLLRKSNPSLLEWLFSPVVYREISLAIGEMRAISRSIAAPRQSLFYHYLHMASGNYRKYIEDRAIVLTKKYLYVVRPLIMLLYLEQHSGDMPYSVSFPAILAGVEIPEDTRECIEQLIVRKRAGDELGFEPYDAVLNNFIEAHFERWKSIRPDAGSHDRQIMQQQVSKVLQRVLDESSNTMVSLSIFIPVQGTEPTSTSSEMIQRWICQRCKQPQAFFDPQKTVWLNENEEQLNVCAKCYHELARTKQIVKETF